MSTIRFDGIYQSGLVDNSYWHYLRFYPNGTVLITSSTGQPAQLLPWFSEDCIATSKLGHGRYEIKDNLVTFFSTSEAGTVDYEGTADSEMLNLSSYSHINGHRASDTYGFIALKQETIIVDADDQEGAIFNTGKHAKEVDEYSGTIAQNPRAPAIVSILNSSALSAEQKQSDLESLLAGLTVGSYREIVYCNCGYPTRVIYRDGSSGPIMEILDSRQVRVDDPYTHEYLCPRCGKHVQTITQ